MGLQHEGMPLAHAARGLRWRNCLPATTDIVVAKVRHLRYSVSNQESKSVVTESLIRTQGWFSWG